MPATQIGQNLAFINWTLLTGLALGAYGAVVLLRRRGMATRGFLGFTTVCAIVFGILAWLSDGALPASLGDSPVTVDPAWDAPRGSALAAFWILAIAGLVVRRVRPPLAPVVELAALGAGVAALVFGALAWGGGSLGTLALLAVVALQVVLFVAWVATAAGPAAGAPFSALTGDWALFVWLRLIVGLIFPLIVSWAAVQTARSRSMESATGLLYINVGTIASGTILAAGLYFGAGLLV